MTSRITPLALSLLAVAAWALFLGVLAGRPEPFVAALPLLLVLAALARPAAPPAYEVALAVSGDRITEGEDVTVGVRVTARERIGLLEVVGPRPPAAVVTAGRHRAMLTLAAGETARFEYALRFPRRGAHELAPVVGRALDGSRLRAWERGDGAPIALAVYPRIAHLRALPRPVHARASVGDYVSPALGEGVELGDIRPFAPGDRIRQVNWPASLRRQALHVTHRQRERNADVVLMLDTLAEAGAAPDTTLDHGVRAAAALASAYLARKDRVGLITYGGLVHWVKPASGRTQLERLVDALLRAAVVFTYVAKDLAVVPPRVLPPQALVIAITPLLDPRFAHAVLDLAGRGFDTVVLAVSPVAVTRAALGPSPGVDLACRLWALDRRGAAGALRRAGLAVLEWAPPEPLEAALAGSDRRRPRRAAAG